MALRELEVPSRARGVNDPNQVLRLDDEGFGWMTLGVVASGASGERWDVEDGGGVVNAMGINSGEVDKTGSVVG